MKKLFVAMSAVAALGIGIANAADLPNVKEPPVFTPPAFSWTGLYIGINAGGAFGDSALFATELPSPAAFGGGLTPTPFSQHISAAGFLGGAQVGYNFQVAGPYVFGIETDFQGSTLRESSTLSGLFGFPYWNNVATDRLGWFGTVRGRIGFAVDRALFYATGGLIYGQVYSSTLSTFTPFANPAFIYSGSDSDVRAGFTVGGGIEYAINPNWSVKAEGLYYNLGSQSYIAYPLAANPPFAISDRVALTGAIGRVGINYRFDLFAPPGPVVAKY
jgi:outer membrane immunogenic protein